MTEGHETVTHVELDTTQERQQFRRLVTADEGTNLAHIPLIYTSREDMTINEAPALADIFPTDKDNVSHVVVPRYDDHPLVFISSEPPDTTIYDKDKFRDYVTLLQYDPDPDARKFGEALRLNKTYMQVGSIRHSDFIGYVGAHGFFATGQKDPRITPIQGKLETAIALATKRLQEAGIALPPLPSEPVAHEIQEHRGAVQRIAVGGVTNRRRLGLPIPGQRRKSPGSR